MLQPVSLGHHRCICPGLSLDGRGIPLGQQLALFFPELSAVKSFIATASAETSLERLIPSLEIASTENHAGIQNWMVRFDISDAYEADPMAQWARLHRGRAFTGTQSHFVPYRDPHAPTGYDLEDPLSVVRGASGLVVYAPAGVDERHIKKKISLLALALDLGLSPLSLKQQKKREQKRASFFLPEPLLQPFLSYVQRLDISGELRPVFADSKGLFAPLSKTYYLVSCAQAPDSLVHLMANVPGVEVLIPILNHVFVAWPYAHPFTLENISPIFPEDRLFVFSFATHGAFSFQSHGQPIELSHLSRMKLNQAQVYQEIKEVHSSPGLSKIAIPVRLTPHFSPKPQVDAVFIPNRQLPWIQSLLYRLPNHLLEESKGLLTKDGLFVLSPDGTNRWPMGDYYQLMGSDVFLPWGMHWVPKVSSRHVRSRIDVTEECFCFVQTADKVISLPKQDFQPLSKAILAPWTVEQLETSLLTQVRHPASEIVHSPQKRFVLWRGIKWDKSSDAQPLPSVSKSEDQET